MNKKLLLSLLLGLSLAIALHAYRWPVPEASLAHGFGTFRHGLFMRGLEFDNQDGSVQAVGDGELVFACYDGKLPGGFPLPGQGLVAIAHRQDVLSVYSGLAVAPASALPELLYEGDVVGYTRHSQTQDAMLQLYFYDRQGAQFVNPLTLLPQLADTRPPQLRAAFLRSGEREIALDQARGIAQGQYSVLIDSLDLLPFSATMLPFSVSLLVNGVERQRYVYDAVQVSRGELMVSSGSARTQAVAFKQTGQIDLGRYLLASGTTVLSVIIRDFNNNRLERSWTVTVQ